MKKSLLMVGLVVLVGLGFQSGKSWVKAESASPKDETVLISLMERTMTPKMIFEGGTANWSVSYKVMDTVIPNKNERKTQTLFDLVPLTAQDQNGANKRKFKYMARHSQGWLGGEQWVKTGERISLVSNAPAPSAAETIQVKVSEAHNCSEEVFNLTNTIPLNAIPPEKAFRKAFEKYYAVFGAYPTEQFTFEMQFAVYEKQYWEIIFDDNDGIGGQGFLLIDALTGEVGDIKVDE